MDCEKFENLLIDELYGELDEVTSAAVRRHAAGCARCGALLSGLRATRKVAALPVEEPSADLEDRILSAVREQQKVLPFRARFAVALSRAGAWAMRPQTAMAAVFLVVIGTSFVLVQSRKSIPASASQTNAEGAPVAAVQAAPNAPYASAYALDGKEAAFAHGVEEKEKLAEPSTVTALPMAAAVVADNVATDEASKDKWELGNSRGGISNGGVVAGAGGGSAAGDLDAPAVARRSAPGSTSATTGAERMRSEAQGHATAQAAPPSFGAAKLAYDTRRFDDARNQFDTLAASDPTAALWAGRAEKAKNGCSAAAIQRFESARQRAPSGSAVANDATLEAAHCYRAAGNTALARARLASLLGQQGYASNAQNELDQLSPAAAAHKAAHESPAQVRAIQAAPPQATTAPAQKAAGY